MEKGESRESRVQSKRKSEYRAERGRGSREQRAERREPRAESREQRAESTKQRAEWGGKFQQLLKNSSGFAMRFPIGSINGHGPVFDQPQGVTNPQ